MLLAVSDLDRLALRLATVQRYQRVTLTLPLSTLADRWHQRIAQRSPVQYVIGKAPWRDFELVVSGDVLIPRPETEELIDLVLQVTLDQPSLRQGSWADIGTGSGAIALGLAQALPDAMIYAVDYSPKALAVAQQNAQQYQLSPRIQFYQGSWFEPLQQLKGQREGQREGQHEGQLSGMVSNPPYIPSAMVPSLASEVQHDPLLALDGGADGLDAIRQLVTQAPAYLGSGGLWLIETMIGQTDAVGDLLAQGPYRDIQVFEDLSGIARFVLAYRR